MKRSETRSWAPHKDPWFLLGVAVGLIVVVPKIVLQFGVVWGNQGEPAAWATYAGFVAWFAMMVGGWLFGGFWFYPAIALGVIANGLLYATVGLVMRRGVGMATSLARKGGGHSGGGPAS
jgi:hypothetical protein